MKRSNWDGNDIKTLGALSKKLDGICCIIDREKGYCVSRNGKRLLHTENIYKKYSTTGVTQGEIFYKNFKETIQLVKTFGDYQIELEDFYPHTPVPWIDERIILLYTDNILAENISQMLYNNIKKGHEGLVFQSVNGDIIKIKKSYTYDVEVIGIEEGKGRNEGVLGALITPNGKVGTGFTDKERVQFYSNDFNIIGKIIEVGCMELTETGKFRHPRFIRLREDK
jgi:hypothetical protein